MPNTEVLVNPVLQALRDLGGSGSISEIDAKVCSNLKLPKEITEQPHLKTHQSEISYRLAWARTYLKRSGLL